MAGFNLNDGICDNRQLSDDELWSIFSFVFSSKSKNDTSYKFGFLKAILDNLYNVDNNLKLSFDKLFMKFTEIYWNLILKYKLRQKAVTKDNKRTYLEQIIEEELINNKIITEISFEALNDSIKLFICHKIKMKCKQNVVGALYGDTQGVFYSFSKKEEYIQLNPQVFTFLSKHKKVIEKLNYYEWAKFLEKVNDNDTTQCLLNKLDYVTKRNDLSVYRQILYDEFEEKHCFYCGKELSKTNIKVDHFIPWSFIKDDNLWNFVLTCSECNNKKRDKLPDEKYLDGLVERNRLLIENNTNLVKNELSTYKENKLRNIYSWALFNGYNNIFLPNIKAGVGVKL
ncbi:MAG: HNH endonuclease domain-containing protein [Sedimentibacter sp.]|uniref:HNH endonuclease domain-containing protein n=1 Tax=Sedimentibacter sp. TaxID=1960295 RepID=UPI0029828D0A|nr:HNH endonuclease domain-containing protein [Sedimentibacter sp.]MDW5300714.1 HNH endonuclease domain-containing protein [Sedimentibacter sp.]